ncbi:uncharacterized protein P884DRAFT_262841 [Thermothelomyces heterothallicus CBS 202.75]|uniref:uncharacterized protein n=1 Tax=Thermothelomyces heterothallicus CBS 202.75 TaxID=1149848 RepID=UPI003743368A
MPMGRRNEERGTLRHKREKDTSTLEQVILTHRVSQVRVTSWRNGGFAGHSEFTYPNGCMGSYRGGLSNEEG